MLEELKELVECFDEGEKMRGGLANALESGATQLIVDMWQRKADLAQERLNKALEKSRATIVEALKVN